MPLRLCLIFILSVSQLIVNSQDLGQLNSEDQYERYQSVKAVNALGNTKRLSNRNQRTHILDSLISYNSPNNFFTKTEYAWEIDKVIEYNSKRIFQNEEWIPQDCSEYGFNSTTEQITHFYYGTCDSMTPDNSREYFYDADNKLYKLIGYRAATDVWPESNVITLYSYDDEDQLIRTENFLSETGTPILTSIEEFMYGDDNELITILGYDVIDSANPTIILNDSTSVKYTEEGLLKSIVDYHHFSQSGFIEHNRKDYEYNNLGLLLKLTIKNEYSLSQDNWYNIEINEWVYGLNNTVEEFYLTPVRREGQDLSTTQLYEQSLQGIIETDDTVPIENVRNAFNVLDHSPLNTVLETVLTRTTKTDKVTVYNRDFAWLTIQLEYFYSNLSVSTQEPAFSDFSIVLSPNPASSKTSVLLGEKFQLTSICIYDLQGRLITCQEETEIDLDVLSAGIYLVEVSVTGGGKTVEKLVKH